MNNLLVSIIIPFYNPKSYFNELLESVSNQSYKNIEVVLIDDGSDEVYNNLAKNFISLAENRVLITKKNGGVASARQAGIDVSTGDLIIHADDDDLIPEFAIENLVKKMMATEADIVIGGYVVRHAKKETYVGIDENESYWGFVEGMLSGKYHGGLWNKLIKRSLYNSVNFEPGLNYMEDKLILAKMFSYGPHKISYLNEPIYIYRQNSSSATYDMSIESVKSSVIVIDKIASLYRGVLKEDLIDTMVKRQRVSEIFQSAKKGLNVFSNADAMLVKDQSFPFRFRFVLWLISKDLLFIVKLMSEFKKKLS